MDHYFKSQSLCHDTQIDFDTKYDFKTAVELYNSVGLRTRNMDFFSKWVFNVYQNLFYLPSADLGFINRLAVDKTKLSIFAILVDDLADNTKLRNKILLEKAVQIPRKPDEKLDVMYLEITRRIWRDVISSIEQYPRYGEFKEMFYFDLDQFLDAIRYASLINNMEIENPLENKIYFHHNMMIIVFLDIDLMCSPYFNNKELKKFRPISYWIQDVCHVGNILSTYKREITEEDFSSPIIALGLEKELFTKKEMMRDPSSVLEKLDDLIPFFQDRVENDFHNIETYTSTMQTIDIEEFSKKLRTVYQCFLKRPKYWEINQMEQKETQHNTIKNDNKQVSYNILSSVRM